MKFARAPSGLILPARVADALHAAARRPKAVEFFAGAGGMSLGFKMAGWHVVAASEMDCSAAMTYAANLCRYGDLTMHFVEDSDHARMEKTIEGEFKRSGGKRFPTAGSGWISHHPDVPGTQHLFIGDVRKLIGRRILDAIGMEPGELDCVAGGPPCQGFSRAGRQNVMDPRNSLVFEYARLILDLRPKTMIMENVPGILDMVTEGGVPVVDAFCRILEDGDFATMDALKHSIGAQTGAAGGLRGSGRLSKKSLEKRERRAAKAAKAAPTVAAGQVDLFGQPCGDVCT